LVEGICSALRISGDTPSAGVDEEETVALDAVVVDICHIAVVIISVIPA
jgi:hypothetical protein